MTQEQVYETAAKPIVKGKSVKITDIASLQGLITSQTWQMFGFYCCDPVAFECMTLSIN